MQVDLSKRYGCLAGGVNDIKNHPWFRALDFAALKTRQLQPPIRCGSGRSACMVPAGCRWVFTGYIAPLQAHGGGR